jgi:hypothetical protein
VNGNYYGPDGKKLPYSADGKRLPTISEYASLLSPIMANEGIKIHPIGMITGDSEDLYPVQIETDKFALMPGPEFSPWLYRGQNGFHDNCKASIYRNNDYASYILSEIKLCECRKLLLNHPIVHLLFGMTIQDNLLAIDFESLAQHYGLSTDMLDFTRSRDIAMFFATCSLNRTTNQYEPILDETTEAAIYMLDVKTIINSGDQFSIIGFQPLLRPCRQKAFSVRQKPSDNLNLKTYITYEKIRIDKTQSEKYYEMFEGGNALFPDEVIGDKIRILRDSKEIDMEVVEFLFAQNLFPEDIKNEQELRQLLGNQQITISDKGSELSFSQSEVSLIEKDWQIIQQDYLPRIKTRLCCDSAQSD